jgi:multidrug efflux pump
VRTAIGNANVNQAKGSFDGPRAPPSTPTTSCVGRRVPQPDHRLQERRAGAPVRRGRWSTAPRTRLAAWAEPAAGGDLNIQRQPGANVIAVVDRIKALLPQLQASLPASIDVRC